MKPCIVLLCTLFSLQNAFSQTATVNLEPFSSGYTLPLGIENCGDSRLFIVQKNGQIMISDANGNKLATPFLDISDRITTTNGEQGVLGLAFDPDYSTNGFFYLNYIDLKGNTQISRFKVSATNANKANKNSEKLILNIPQPYSNHNGGCIRFGKDGYLYIAMGDGGNGGDPQNNSQNPRSLLGKMLRINVKTNAPYTVPATNPFKNTPGYAPEIWALGLRNPWRFSFDNLSGALITADVGQELWEEVNLQPVNSKGGENYGWRCYEGNHDYNTSGCSPRQTYTFPVYEYAHSDVTNDCSITGGFVYRGKQFTNLYGKYFFADYCSGFIRTLTMKKGAVTKEDVYHGDAFAYTSFGENAGGELFVTNYGNGTIYHITSGATVTKETPVVSMRLYPNPTKQSFYISFKTTLAEECTIAVFEPNGRQVLQMNKTARSGDNIWSITVPSFVKGSCYVTVTSTSGSLLRQSILIQ